MLFNTWVFVIFFVAVYLAYLKTPFRAQNWLLLAASYVFYGFWDVRFLSLIVISTAVDYVCALRIAASDSPRRRRAFLAVSMCMNLGLLAAFKYCDFFLGSAEALVRAMGYDPASWRLGIVVPVGISFYTFQTMSYTIDVYRRQLAPCRSPWDFALYVAFFPQLVAGPIERGTRLLPQVCQPRTLTAQGIRQGVWWLLVGYFMKVFVADNLATIAEAAFAAQRASGAKALLGTYAFAFQIYCDFAGYSHIARGLASLMGFQLMTNFRVPYLATNPRDFWGRWHISLSTWLRDYLYIPLGGNRGGTARTYRNLLLTMLLGGLWHGAEWKFVLWGLYHGVLLVAFRAMEPRAARAPEQRRWTFGRACRAAGFFHLVCLGWVIFRCNHLGQVWQWPWRIVTAFGWTTDDAHTLAVLAFLIAPVVLLDVLTERAKDINFLLGWRAPLRWSGFAVLLGLLYVFGSRGAEQFIYFQF